MIDHDKVRLKGDHILFQVIRICLGEKGILVTQYILQQFEDFRIIVQDKYLFLLLHMYMVCLPEQTVS